MKNVELAIVGGGAAGMFAAAAAAKLGVRALLIERKARLGAKVLMTANGRCNFTRDLPASAFLADLGREEAARFAAPALELTPPGAIIAMMRELNLPLRRMPDGRMFPADGKAASVVHAFGDLFRDLELPMLLNCPVQAIERGEAGRLKVRTAVFELEAENVLIATGGASYPKTGSVGDGQRFAAALGHRIVPLKAGLIGLETAAREVTALAPRRVEDGRLRIVAPDGRVLFEYAGEIDCERFGLSGAAVYNAQRFLAHHPEAAATATLEAAFGRVRLRLTAPFTPRPLKEAIVTLGGVALDEVDPETMASRIVPRLYFAGEVLDLDGPTGGYNLTLAFATAYLAVAAIAGGRSALKPGRAIRQAWFKGNGKRKENGHGNAHRPGRKFRG